MNDKEIEMTIEMAIMKSFLEKVLSMIEQSTDENLRNAVVQMIHQVGKARAAASPKLP